MKRVTIHTNENTNNYVDMIPPTPDAWNWSIGTPNAEIHIFEDLLLPNHVNYDNVIKIAYIVEAPAIYDFCQKNDPTQFNPHKWIINNHHYFKFVMSPYKQIKSVVGKEKYLWVPVGGNRIKPNDYGMYEKERLISIVASHKQWTFGHKLRHEIIKRYPGKIDIYGSGYNNIIDEYENRLGKIIAVGPYFYSFAVMNSKENGYFTEILTDVLATGTIPLWWGSDDIGEYFDLDGIVSFNTLEELDKIIPTLTPELYTSKLNAITKNIELSKHYNTRFDWLYNNYKDKLESL